MKALRLILSVLLFLAMPAASQAAQGAASLGDNAALRYWSAFAEMQDSAITKEGAKELNRILEGTAPYDDAKYKDLVEKNRAALATMARGTALANCNWGIDYQLGSSAPVDYVRKGLTLGRLNVLYTYHLLATGDNDGAVRMLTSGLRFSRDVANGGTLFATLVAKNLLAAHLRAVSYALLHDSELSAIQRQLLKMSVAGLGPAGLDWQSAMKRELGIFRAPFWTPEGVQTLNPQASAALGRLTPMYVSALSNPSLLPRLQQMRTSAPHPLPDLIPNPKRVIEEKQDLTRQIRQVSAMLR